MDITSMHVKEGERDKEILHVIFPTIFQYLVFFQEEFCITSFIRATWIPSSSFFVSAV